MHTQTECTAKWAYGQYFNKDLLKGYTIDCKSNVFCRKADLCLFYVFFIHHIFNI